MIYSITEGGNMTNTFSQTRPNCIFSIWGKKNVLASRY